MKEYAIEVIETLSRVEYIEAEDEDEALKIARTMYFDEGIVLDSSDWMSTDFYVYED